MGNTDEMPLLVRLLKLNHKKKNPRHEESGVHGSARWQKEPGPRDNAGGKRTESSFLPRKKIPSEPRPALAGVGQLPTESSGCNIPGNCFRGKTGLGLTRQANGKRLWGPDGAGVGVKRGSRVAAERATHLR